MDGDCISKRPISSCDNSLYYSLSRLDDTKKRYLKFLISLSKKIKKKYDGRKKIRGG